MFLNCKTYFSFRYGTFSTDSLVQTGAAAGLPWMALTNINTTADAWEFYEACLLHGIRPILGTEIRNGAAACYVLLAKSLDGFQGINHFLSVYLQKAAALTGSAREPVFPTRPSAEDRVLLTDNVWIVYPMDRTAAPASSKTPGAPGALHPNELLGVRTSEITRLYGRHPESHPDKYIILQPLTFQDQTHFNLHRLLRAIDKNTLLSKQEPKDLASASEILIPPAKILEDFEPYPSIVRRTLQVADTCQIVMPLGTDKNKAHFTESPEGDRLLLGQLALEGARYRYGQREDALERVRKELKIIDDLHFNAYFLITWDVVRFAQSRGFYYVGRGSGANSIIAYCLRITDVDPIQLDLYFERFLNPQRTSPPDFDIDFSWKDRDEVFDYVFHRYGRDHVALLGMFSTFQRSATIRELGKVFGLPKSEIDALVENRKAALQEDAIQRLIRRYSLLLENFPNHGSIHPGGVLISEAPIYRYTAVGMPPKGFATSQVDMFVAEKVGLYKLDLLSQRGLGHIKDCLSLVRENKGIGVDIHDVEHFKQDPLVASRIRNADSIGCFYIESPAMRQLLQKLRCSDYLTLVAASSIIRPGVAQSGMMRQYIHRFHHPDRFEYLHPKMEALLKETYGVMVYQEDVIKVAHHFAGLDLAEADVLRRAMSGKYRTHNQFRLIREKFFGNCKSLGYADDLAAEVWRQIESFGGYSFSKAHSASFAVESYQSLYLKTYFPMEFMVAVINNFGGFYRTEVYFHELRRTGAEVLPPCLNEGAYHTSIQGIRVYTGLIHIQGLEEDTARKILEEREAGGRFRDLPDLLERCSIAPEQVNLLIRAGALGFTGKGKKELLWEAGFMQRKQRQPAGAVLFREAPLVFRLPVLTCHPLDDALDQLELLGFPLADAWALADAPFGDFMGARELADHVGKTISLLGYFVTAKQARTAKGESMFFGTFLDKRGEWLDTVHFPQSADRHPLQGKGYYALRGRVIEEFGVHSVEVLWLKKVGIRNRASAAPEK